MRVLGFMSGTSLDGVDAAILDTDGERVAAFGPAVLLPFTDDERAVLVAGTEAAVRADRAGQVPPMDEAMQAIVLDAHMRAARIVAAQADGAIDLVGFHGQTILHRPERKLSLQVGDPGALADALGVPVIACLRQGDLDAGGEGAPLVPVFHAALADRIGMERPVAFLNLGGVANLTWLGADGECIAFDTGPANGMIDLLVQSRGMGRYDDGGRLAAAGRVDDAALKSLLDSSYFTKHGAKSLDRYDFPLDVVQQLGAEDAAATLTAFTVEALRLAVRQLPAAPGHWVVCGGGRHNPTLMRVLRERLGDCRDIDDYGLRGDFVEAEAMAFLAARSVRGLPITFPGTTGVPVPTTGGRRFDPVEGGGMSPALRTLSAALSDVFGDRLLVSEARRGQFMAAEGHHAPVLPDMVVQPRSVAEVQRLMTAAQAAGVAIVPLGVGTSLEGNATAIAGAVSVDLSGMDHVLEIVPEDLLCVVEPGVTREGLNTELRSTGLFFPIDPGANATIGGMIATRASGTNAVRYGTIRENVLALKVVLPDGTLIATGTRARKSAAGYDLTHLFTGSEGTLGIVVEATVRLHGIPDTVLSGSWPFETLEGAVDTVIATVQSGIPVARMELLDPVAIRSCNAFAGLDLPERPTLFVELHGSLGGVSEQREVLAAIGAGFGGGLLKMSADADEQRRLWRARHAALPAARALVPGAVTWSTDICVPISRLASAIAGARAAIDAAGLIAPILGHVGDGNYHVFFVLRPDDAAGWAAARAVNAVMIDYALSVGGTCTGEHGIGVGKREALRRESGSGAVDLMRRLKDAVDPNNMMNPGKIFL